MRKFKHLTPAYIMDRVREKWYRRTYPGDPWLTPMAIHFLRGFLKPTDRGLEFGSGRSTLWFARIVSFLTSVEHDTTWFHKVSEKISQQKITNVAYLHIPIVAENQGDHPDYVKIADQFNDESLDFILVDGRYRDMCANAVLPKLKPGAILILDNADVYLPSDCRTPNARSFAQGPSSEGWTRYLKNVKEWRCFWTCNGISATAIYFKPFLS